MSRIEKRERTPVSLGTMIRDAHIAVSSGSDHPAARRRQEVSFASLYRGTEYETHMPVFAASTPVSRGRVFVLLTLAATFVTSALVVAGSLS